MASLTPVYKVLKEEEMAVELPTLGVPLASQPNACCEDGCCKGGCCKCCKDGCNGCKKGEGCEKEKKGCDWNQDGKCKRRSLARRICGCLCGFLVFATLLWMIASLATLTYVGAKVYRCVNPRHAALTEFIFDDDEVKEFDLGVAAGAINVRTCSRIEKMTLFVTRKASTTDLLNVMPLEKKFEQGVFSLNAYQPSFDLQHCQHVVMELVIPERLAAKQHLALKAQTVVGKILVTAPKYTFEKLTLFANVGVVKADGVKTSGTFEAESRVGFVSAKNVEAKGASLKSTVGFICSGNIVAEELDVFVETGRGRLDNVAAPTVTLTSEVGFISANNFRSVRSVTGRVDYGRLSFSPDEFNGKFVVESPYGFIDVSTGKHTAQPKLEQNTPAIISGQFGQPASKLPSTSMVVVKPKEINLKGVFAQVSLFVPDAAQTD